jgi:sterol 3beta-glucosyltransferase
MRIAIVSNDTRGGIQPYVALGLGLARAGHDVRMVAPSDYAPMLAEAGLPMAPLSGSVEAVLRGASGASELGTLASMRFVAKEMRTRIHDWTRETLEACDGVELVTGGVGGMVLGLSVAEKLGVPFLPSHVQPVSVPTAAYPGVLLPALPRLGGLGHQLGHRLTELALWMPFKGGMTSARRAVLGLTGRPTAADGQPVLYGFSRHVVPMTDGGAPERHVTGYWFLPAAVDWRPSPDLEGFLAGDGPVVSIGFGSMSSDDPGAVTEMVVGAVRDAGVRAVLLSGWGGLENERDSDDVFVADTLPHDWLFPQMAAVVHHGGAGTTGAALAAGVPSIVIPFAVDQPFWGSRVATLGVGPTPIPRKRLTREGLTAALRTAVTDAGMRSKAAALGERIRAEDGVAEAVRQFERRAPSR